MYGDLCICTVCEGFKRLETDVSMFEDISYPS